MDWWMWIAVTMIISGCAAVLWVCMAVAGMADDEAERRRGK